MKYGLSQSESKENLSGLCTLYTFAAPKQILLNSKNQTTKQRTAHKPMKAQAWEMQADS
jgi:hypothetical protein